MGSDLGNEVSIQYTQGSAELQKLSQANSFSSFIALQILLLFRGIQGWNTQVIAARIYRAKPICNVVISCKIKKDDGAACV
jgi:hypothetical protein